MTADDIRELNHRLQEQMLNSQTVAEHEAGFKSLLLSIASEFVAQVAEMNEHLREIASPKVTVEESPWVQLSWRGRQFLVNRNDASSAHQGGLNRTESVLIMRTDVPEDGGRSCEMPLAELCAKLHIPYKEPA